MGLSNSEQQFVEFVLILNLLKASIVSKSFIKGASYVQDLPFLIFTHYATLPLLTPMYASAPRAWIVITCFVRNLAIDVRLEW